MICSERRFSPRKISDSGNVVRPRWTILPLQGFAGEQLAHVHPLPVMTSDTGFDESCATLP